MLDFVERLDLDHGDFGQALQLLHQLPADEREAELRDAYAAAARILAERWAEVPARASATQKASGLQPGTFGISIADVD
jgi:hypothetical protein